jgi:hypothetical protein
MAGKGHDWFVLGTKLGRLVTVATLHRLNHESGQNS